MDCILNAIGHGKNLVCGLNYNDKYYLKEKIEFDGNFKTNDTSNIGMIPWAPKFRSINFIEQCLHIITNKDRLNGLKVCKKIAIVSIKIWLPFLQH